MKLPKTSIIFARNISHRFPGFLPAIAFAQKFSIANSGKSNGNFGGEKQWAKAMRKFGKRRHIFGANFIALPEFLIAFSPNFHCFCPNFPLLLPEFFVLIFFFFFFWGGGGAGIGGMHSAPCTRLLYPTPMMGAPSILWESLLWAAADSALSYKHGAALELWKLERSASGRQP